MERKYKAERALLGRILFKNKNQFGRRFRVFDRIRAVFDASRDIRDPVILDKVDQAKNEILKLIPLGHNLPFLLPSLAALARIHCLVLMNQSGEVHSSEESEEDLGEPV